MDQRLNDLPGDLRRALDQLDSLAAERAARVDAGRVAERVVAALREPVVTVRVWRRTLLRVAAVAVLLLGGAAATWVAVRSGAPAAGPRAAVTTALPVVPDADGLDREVVAALLEVVDSSRVSAAAAGSALARTTLVTLDDLSETELEALLETMESSEGTL